MSLANIPRRMWRSLEMVDHRRFQEEIELSLGRCRNGPGRIYHAGSRKNPTFCRRVMTREYLADSAVVVGMESVWGYHSDPMGSRKELFCHISG